MCARLPHPPCLRGGLGRPRFSDPGSQTQVSRPRLGAERETRQPRKIRCLRAAFLLQSRSQFSLSPLEGRGGGTARTSGPSWGEVLADASRESSQPLGEGLGSPRTARGYPIGYPFLLLMAMATT